MVTTILNLGCGTKTSPRCVNIDWSIYLRVKRNPIARLFAPLVMRGDRLARFKGLADNVVVHNLRKGIPAEDGSVDAVYHSHVFEHIDRADAPGFLAEVRRVLEALASSPEPLPLLEVETYTWSVLGDAFGDAPLHERIQRELDWVAAFWKMQR